MEYPQDYPLQKAISTRIFQEEGAVKREQRQEWRMIFHISFPVSMMAALPVLRLQYYLTITILIQVTTPNSEKYLARVMRILQHRLNITFTTIYEVVDTSRGELHYAWLQQA